MRADNVANVWKRHPSLGLEKTPRGQNYGYSLKSFIEPLAGATNAYN